MVNENGWLFDVYADINGDLRKALKSNNLPQSMIIQGGKVIYEQSGYGPVAKIICSRKFKPLHPGAGESNPVTIPGSTFVFIPRDDNLLKIQVFIEQYKVGIGARSYCTSFCLHPHQGGGIERSHSQRFRQRDSYFFNSIFYTLNHGQCGSG